jgi:ABC-type glycerol-3-phosphate transport system substrate-binding protein
VDLIPLGWDQMGDISGETADVLATSATVLSLLNDAGELLPLDPFLQNDAAVDVPDLYPALLDNLVHEGLTWALPAGVDVYVMYINDDLFSGSDATYPDLEWTWADFLDRALATRDDTMRLYGYTTTPGHIDAILFIYQNGGRIVDSETNPTELIFDDPLAIEALDWYGDLFHDHDVAPTTIEARTAFGGGNYAIYQGIRNGRVAMWMLPLSQRGGMMWPVEWLPAWRVAPPPRGAFAASTADLEAFAISRQTPYPDACWRWVSFLSRQMTYRLVPARRSLAESDEFEDALGEEIAIAARHSLENAVMFSPQLDTRLGDDLALLRQAIANVIEGEMTAPEAMDWAALQSGS